MMSFPTLVRPPKVDRGRNRRLRRGRKSPPPDGLFVRQRRRVITAWPRRWAFVWWTDRFDGDIDWFKPRLSVPNLVRVDSNGTVRFPREEPKDLDVLKESLQDAYTRAPSPAPAEPPTQTTPSAAEPAAGVSPN